MTKNTKVPDSAVHAYYLAHQSIYTQLPSRNVRHILVKSPTLAQTIYAQLKSGNDKAWCTLAKKYSLDPSSKNACGKLTVQQGQTVPEFNKVAFTEKTKVVHAPVHSSQYGWFVIEPLSSVKPKSSTPEKQVASTIRQQLLQTDKNQAMTDWVTSLTKSFCSGSKIKYQVGYAPSPDPCASTTNAWVGVPPPDAGSGGGHDRRPRHVERRVRPRRGARGPRDPRADLHRPHRLRGCTPAAPPADPRSVASPHGRPADGPGGASPRC